MFGYHMPTRVYIAPGCLSRLPESVRALQMRSLLLVSDPGLRATEWPEKTRRQLEDIGLRIVVFDEIEPNPRTTTAARAAEILRSEELEGVVGLGGGSVLDTAKAASMLATNGEFPPQHYEGKNRYVNPPLPFVAVPTTCGTGSEVTWVSVLSHEPTRAKISIKGDSMYPDQALVDADLIRTLPAELVAWTGMDALTHALEATTCRVANPVSDALAEKTIALVLLYLRRAAADIGGDDEARQAMMRASTIAGLSFSNADVAAVHCLSESIGGLFDVPHGLANAILLVPTLRQHGEAIEERLARIERLLDPKNAEAPENERAASFMARLESLVQDLAIPAWSTLGIGAESHAEIAEKAVRNNSNRSNPRPMAKHDYLEILEGLG